MQKQKTKPKKVKKTPEDNSIPLSNAVQIKRPKILSKRKVKK